MVNEKAIKVAELRAGETGRGIARMDPELMKILGIKVGDIVQIDGNKKTAVKVYEGGLEDSNRGIIRIDGSTRRNAGVSIDERVAVKKITVKAAEKITFAPSDQLRLQGGEDYLKQAPFRQDPCARPLARRGRTENVEIPRKRSRSAEGDRRLRSRSVPLLHGKKHDEDRFPHGI